MSAIENAIQQMIEAARKHSDFESVRFTLVVTGSDYSITWDRQDPAGLKRNGWTMRNMRGEWIKSEDAA